MSTDTIHVFVGFDERQTVNSTVAHQSLLATTRQPLAIHPLTLRSLAPYGFTRRGLTPFTYSRFLVPFLMGFQGWAIFMDSDIVSLRDIGDLLAWCRHDAGSKEVPPAVYVRDKPGFEFERAAIMVFNCGQPALQYLTPKVVGDAAMLPAPHIIDEDDQGRGLVNSRQWAAFPEEWGVLIGYEPVPANIAMAHFTQGVPCHDETNFMPLRDVWQGLFQSAVSTQPWQATMGPSVHAHTLADGRKVPVAHPLALAEIHAVKATPAPAPDPTEDTRRLYGDDFADHHPHITEPK